MNENHILFEHAGPFNNITVSCIVCGAMICDWRKPKGEFTSLRPNQEKHVKWHQSIQSDK